MSGDVVGPASATNNAVATYDGITGKVIQNTAVIVDGTTLYADTITGLSADSVAVSGISLSIDWPTAIITPVADSDIPVAIVPKGTGSITSRVPDGTSSGGDERGVWAVDWQMSRSTAEQVASGGLSVIGGGEENTASAMYATVAGGSACVASGEYSTVGGGASNTASGENSCVPGGCVNTATGDNSFAAGKDAHAIHAGAVVFADGTVARSSTAAKQFYCHFLNGFRMNGGTLGLNDRAFTYSAGAVSTVGAVTADLYNMGTAAGAVYQFRFDVVGKTAANAFTASALCTAKNIGGVVTIVGTYGAGSAGDAALGAATVAFAVNATNIVVRCAGVAGQTISWRGTAVQTVA